MYVSLLRVKEEKMKTWLHAHALYSVHRLRRKKNWERKWKKNRFDNGMYRKYYYWKSHEAAAGCYMIRCCSSCLPCSTDVVYKSVCARGVRALLASQEATIVAVLSLISIITLRCIEFPRKCRVSDSWSREWWRLKGQEKETSNVLASPGPSPDGWIIISSLFREQKKQNPVGDDDWWASH